MRRPSFLTRALRSLTALITVWCLGCGAFDPLIASLIPGDGRTMVCASEGLMSVQQAGQAHGSSVAPTPNRDAGDGATCGCESCSAPAPTDVALVVPPPLLPHQPAADAGTPPSVARTPLVPPPQRAA